MSAGFGLAPILGSNFGFEGWILALIVTVIAYSLIVLP